ncbi:MAG: hypothetical protein PUG64_05440, partial [Bacteroidales bacterium]|nr:hypothetical protein [Bacteroidales bacterium]
NALIIYNTKLRKSAQRKKRFAQLFGFGPVKRKNSRAAAQAIRELNYFAIILYCLGVRSYFRASSTLSLGTIFS